MRLNDYHEMLLWDNLPGKNNSVIEIYLRMCYHTAAWAKYLDQVVRYTLLKVALTMYAG